MPGDRESGLELGRVLRVDAPALLEGERQALGRRPLADRTPGLSLNVVAEQNALPAEQTGRRVDDLRDLLITSVRVAPPKMPSSSSQKRRLNCSPIFPAAEYGTDAIVYFISGEKSVSSVPRIVSGSAQMP